MRHLLGFACALLCYAPAVVHAQTDQPQLNDVALLGAVQVATWGSIGAAP